MRATSGTVHVFARHRLTSAVALAGMSSNFDCKHFSPVAFTFTENINPLDTVRKRVSQYRHISSGLLQGCHAHVYSLRILILFVQGIQNIISQHCIMHNTAGACFLCTAHCVSFKERREIIIARKI